MPPRPSEYFQHGRHGPEFCTLYWDHELYSNNKMSAALDRSCLMTSLVEMGWTSVHNFDADSLEHVRLERIGQDFRSSTT